jgi:transposase
MTQQTPPALVTLKEINSMTHTPCTKEATPTTTGLQKHAKEKRRRASKLSPHFYQVAEMVLRNALAKAEFKQKMSLTDMTKIIQKSAGISVHKSTLCRFLKKHKALKLL